MRQILSLSPRGAACEGTRSVPPRKREPRHREPRRIGSRRSEARAPALPRPRRSGGPSHGPVRAEGHQGRAGPPNLRPLRAKDPLDGLATGPAGPPVDRLRERKISADDIYRLKQWRESDPAEPDGPWYKDFGSFKICGESELPRTFDVCRRALRPRGLPRAPGTCLPHPVCSAQLPCAARDRP